ncbi:MAG: hypothetical protein K0Q94_5482, partial [Paenibacillus sp.]|nr:hypothetical protein [Paenibacillus sp.]
IFLNFEGQATGMSTDEILRDILAAMERSR